MAKLISDRRSDLTTPKPSADLVAKVIEEAADLIETVGHAKGASWLRESAEAPITGYCLTGALSTVMINRSELANNQELQGPLWVRLIYELLNHLPEEEKGGGWVIPSYRLQDWNDSPETTGEQVIDLMKHTAKDLRNRKAAA